MEAHLAALAISGQKLDSISGTLDRLREAWPAPPDRSHSGANLKRAIPGGVAALRDLHRSASDASTLVRHHRLGSMDSLPVHLQHQWSQGRERVEHSAGTSKDAAFHTPTEPVAPYKPCDTSPERIRNPRDRPRRREVRQTVRRKLLPDFKQAPAGPEEECAGDGIPSQKSSMGMFSFLEWGGTSSSQSTVRRDSNGSSALNDSTLTATTSAAADLSDFNHPNDSCIDIHEDLAGKHLRTPRLPQWAVPFPHIPLTSVLSMRAHPLSTHEIQVVCHSVARTLSKLHGQGMVHKHVSPDAVLVDNPANIKSAVLQEPALCSSLNGFSCCYDSKMMNSPAYCAPEIASCTRGAVPSSPASDMWALGAMILAMARPQRPGPFGRRGISSCMRDGPGHPASVDEQQEWIEHRLWDYMNDSTQTWHAHPADPVPMEVQVLVQLLMHADPPQRATADYVLSRTWVADLGKHACSHIELPAASSSSAPSSQAISPASTVSGCITRSASNLSCRSVRKVSSSVSDRGIAMTAREVSRPMPAPARPLNLSPAQSTSCLSALCRLVCEWIGLDSGKKRDGVPKASVDAGSVFWS